MMATKADVRQRAGPTPSHTARHPSSHRKQPLRAPPAASPLFQSSSWLKAIKLLALERLRALRPAEPPSRRRITATYVTAPPVRHPRNARRLKSNRAELQLQKQDVRRHTRTKKTFPLTPPRRKTAPLERQHRPVPSQDQTNPAVRDQNNSPKTNMRFWYAVRLPCHPRNSNEASTSKTTEKPVTTATPSAGPERSDTGHRAHQLRERTKENAEQF